MSNTFHIIPLNDLEPHVEVLVMDELKNLSSTCKCEPRIDYTDGNVFVIHNSFDGREGVEWANEILKPK